MSVSTDKRKDALWTPTSLASDPEESTATKGILRNPNQTRQPPSRSWPACRGPVPSARPPVARARPPALAGSLEGAARHAALQGHRVPPPARGPGPAAARKAGIGVGSEHGGGDPAAFGTPEDAPGLPRLALDGAIEAVKLPVKVGANITFRALDAVTKSLRRR